MTTLLLGNMNYSSWSIRAALVAKMSGLEIDTKVMPLAATETREYLIEKTGYKQVPALISGDLIIRDSLAITEWLAESAALGAIWPSDRRDRARARMVAAEMHSGFTALRNECFVDIRARHSGIKLNPETQNDIARIKDIWAECRLSRKQSGPFLFGDWSAADAFYAPVVTRFRTYGVELNGDDAAYSDAVLSHPDMLAIEAAAEAEPWQMTSGPNGMNFPSAV